jgi:hypothetical protein
MALRTSLNFNLSIWRQVPKLKSRARGACKNVQFTGGVFAGRNAISWLAVIKRGRRRAKITSCIGCLYWAGQADIRYLRNRIVPSKIYLRVLHLITPRGAFFYTRSGPLGSPEYYSTICENLRECFKIALCVMTALVPAFADRRNEET